MRALNLDEGRVLSWPDVRGRPFSVGVGRDERCCCRLPCQEEREAARSVSNWVSVGSPSLVSSASCMNRSSPPSGCVSSMATSCPVRAARVVSSVSGLRTGANLKVNSALGKAGAESLADEERAWFRYDALVRRGAVGFKGPRVEKLVTPGAALRLAEMGSRERRAWGGNARRGGLESGVVEEWW